MAEEEAEAGDSADGDTAGESTDNDADMLATVATAVDPPVPIRAVRAAAAERRSAVAWQCFWSSSPWCWSWSSSP